MDGWTDNPINGLKNNVALAHLYQVGKSCVMFGKILPVGLGGDRVTNRRADGQMDGGIHNILITFLKSMGIISTFWSKTSILPRA